MLKLAFSPTSPYVRKVRVCAAELGLDDQLALQPVTVSPVERNQDYTGGTNPLGKIPALTLENGDVIVDSTIICQYLDSCNPDVQLIPDDDRRWQVLNQQTLATGIADALLLMRYEYVMRPDDLRWVDWYRGQERKVQQTLDWFEQHPQSPCNTAADTVNLAQIALGTSLGYLEFRFPGLEWRPQHPNVTAWYRSFAQRPSMLATPHD